MKEITNHAKMVYYQNIFDIDQIRKNPKDQDWTRICYDEPLSEDFIREFYSYINWDLIIFNSNLSNEVKEFCRMFI